MRAGWSSAEGSRIGWGPVLKIQIRKKFQTFMHAPPYKCCVQVPARMIGKDQSNLNRSHHSSSSVKAISKKREIRCVSNPTVRYMCSTGCTPSFFPLFLLIWKTGVAFGSKGMVFRVWGSRQRKIKAAYQLFLYTLLGSVFMLLAILLILFQTGTTDLQILLTTEFSERRQIFLWIAFFASFAVKVPMVPVHIWLPEAHVEAPTAGSVILAGILLKLGTYGFLRFSIPMFPEATLCFTPFIYTLSAIAIIYTSLTTLRQIDLKKIIAYSSVAHMNLVTIGMFSLNIQGIGGSILLMLSQGTGFFSPFSMCWCSI
ncbi:NADH dehydrogenase [Artemisia annua]|uniref:NADH-ubiquinone oxidoreductase chain 4 n=1 Tax=Artemisia annua TaxID=35608 RepID=A0A2U1QBU8_ARTAN|nr:NADH dehydrogenase [Artemisia annua]